MTCNLCGQKVTVQSADEGTCSYQGLEREAALEEAAELVGIVEMPVELFHLGAREKIRVFKYLDKISEEIRALKEKK